MSSMEEFGERIPYPEPVRILMIIVWFIIILVGVPGNLAVIGIIVKIRLLRTRINMFTLSLSVIDVLIVGYVLPFTLVDLIQERYPIGELFCKVNFCILRVLMVTEAVNIFLIAVGRYLKVCKSHLFNRVFTKRTTFFLCISPWSIGILSSVNIYIDPALVIFDPSLHSCVINDEETTTSQWFVFFIMTCGYIITILCYWKLFKRVRKTHINITCYKNVFSKLKHKTTRSQNLSSLVIFVLLIFLQTPLVVINLGFSEAPVGLHVFFLFLFGLNSSINCIVYGLMNHNVRRVYRQVMPAVRFIRSGKNNDAVAEIETAPLHM